MMENLTRRQLLYGSTATVVSGYAGCLGRSNRNDDPDAGTDSYGLVVDNQTLESHSVSIVVSTIVEKEAMFEEVVQLESGDKQSWDTVFDKDVQHRVVSWIDADERPKSCKFRDPNCGIEYVNVGGVDAPSVTDLRIIVRYGKLPMGTETATLVDFHFPQT